MHNAIAEALRLGMQTVQVFVKNQRQWRAAPLKPDDVAQWNALRETPGFGDVVAHATYLINLAATDDVLWKRSQAALLEELQRCDALNISDLVLHPGAAVDSAPEAACRRVAAALNRIFGDHPKLRARLLLETTAGQGTTLGRTFGELAAILSEVQEPQRIGVCIDTCHVFAAGYDIRSESGVAAMLAEAERTVGLHRVRCLHLNDSKGALGSRIDRHEHIGRGSIGAAGFRNILAVPQFVGLPMILETPKGTDDGGKEWDRVNLRRLRLLARPARPARGETSRRAATSG